MKSTRHFTKKIIMKRLMTLAIATMLVFSMAFQSMAFYQTPFNKKGVLTSDVNMIDDVAALGCSQVILNFNLSFLNDSHTMASFDAILNKMKSRNLTITMIILNDYQPSALLPVASPVGGVHDYALNVSDQNGVNAVTAAASSLAYRYKNTISNWIIGNEVNNASHYNYANGMDEASYAKYYSQGFRIFYNAIKGANPDARVFVPFDFYWNHQVDGTWFKVKTLLPLINAELRDTDYGIAWHPYPQDFANGDFMNRSPLATESMDTLIINMKNLHILTDYMVTGDMLTSAGAPRHLILSEEGFSSTLGEDVQANDIKMAWDIANANPLVEGFLINRLVDNPGQVAAGNRFGLWNTDTSTGQERPTSRKLAWSVYQSCA